MHRARPARPAHFLMIALALCVALAALAAPGRLHAQAPAAVVGAAQADLAQRLGGDDPTAYAVLRAEAVTWSSGCLGIYEPDTACSQALVDGFALWLSDGAVAYRYHTDATGRVVLLAESGIPLDRVAVAPLPEGQVAPPPTDDVTASPLERFLDRLIAATGVDGIYTREIAIERDWIPDSFSPHYVVAEATLEIFALPTAAEAEAAIQRLRQFGGEADLGAGEALWRHESLLIILLDASQHPDTLARISDLIGPTLVRPAIPLSPAAPGPADDEPAPADAVASPEGLPASGNGGLADGDAPAWVWGVIGAVAAGAVMTGVLYRLWLSRRS